MSTKKKTDSKPKAKAAEAKPSESKPATGGCACEASGTKPAGEGCSTGASTTGAAKGGIQNGKGSAPRNISPQFRSNYDGIKWEGGKKRKRQEGTKFVKTY